MSHGRPLLIVSYWYAPSPAVGAKRFSFLAREFTRLGYDVHVVTHEAREWIDWKTDGSLPVAGQVHRCVESVKLPLPGKGLLQRAVNAVARRLLLKPVGWEFLWADAATRKAMEIARSLPRGVVIATSPTPAALLAGKRIARRLRWPLIIDYRDPWSAHEWPAWRRSATAQWIARRLESGVVRRSAARVLNTPAMRASFERFFPRADKARNFVIPNGFEAVAAAPPPPDDGPVHIVHAGEIFTGRSLVPVLEAARRLARQVSRPIRVINYGDLPSVEWGRIRTAGLADFVEVRPRIPFAELFAELQRAHLLLAVVGEHMPYSTPYKVYDYMAAGRPILAVAPRGAALFALLADSGAGVCLERDDIAGIEQALGKFMRGEVAPQRAAVERFRWSHLALQYRNVIEHVAETADGSAVQATSPTAGNALER